ncbi:MAG: metal ABC transporter permease [Phycisphaerales bacterium]|nr:metal ABC transporter permease [Phycisphaerales bacterium]
MFSFLNDLSLNPFLVTGLIAGLLASVTCGVIGPYVVTRRIVFLAGAIAHMAVGGVGAAIWLQASYPDALPWLQPIHGALISAVLAAILIGVVNQRSADRTDTLIGALWAVGMSLGIMLMKFTPGYQAELMSYLFGSITFVSWADVWLMGALATVVVAIVLVAHKRLLGLCVDEEQLCLQGVSVLGTSLLLLVLTALTVVSLVHVVGLILVLALLTLPAATAGHHLRRLGPIMIVSVGLCAVLTTIPRMAVYGTRISPESAIVIAAAGVYLASLAVRRLRRGPA